MACNGCQTKFKPQAAVEVIQKLQEKEREEEGG
jgi:hypothetical protein